MSSSSTNTTTATIAAIATATATTTIATAVDRSVDGLSTDQTLRPTAVATTLTTALSHPRDPQPVRMRRHPATNGWVGAPARGQRGPWRVGRGSPQSLAGRVHGCVRLAWRCPVVHVLSSYISKHTSTQTRDPTTSWWGSRHDCNRMCESRPCSCPVGVRGASRLHPTRLRLPGLRLRTRTRQIPSAPRAAPHTAPDRDAGPRSSRALWTGCINKKQICDVTHGDISRHPMTSTVGRSVNVDLDGPVDDGGRRQIRWPRRGRWPRQEPRWQHWQQRWQ